MILLSARRQQFPDVAMLHAVRNHVRIFELDDLSMLVGPELSGALLEVGIARAESIDFIVHAMLARPEFLE